jgi:hypothetical protein
MEIRMTGACAADLDQHLAGPWLGHRNVPQFTRLLPFNELEGFDGATSVLDPVELDLEV